MTDLAVRLDRLGLSQYLDVLVAEGFDTWETVLDITESDLKYLDFKLGHRRKLQRAIAESRGQPADKALVTEAHKVGSNPDPSDESGTEPKDSHASSQSATGTSGSGTKRKYRRHPKNDPNAPERPPSAYVIFSNQIRGEIKSQELGFTEIAKAVGERWQALLPEVKESYELRANAAKEKFNAAMTEYKKTPNFAQYQDYLVEFKAKHGPSRSEGKRSKLETETSAPLLATMGHLEGVERPQASRSVPILSAPRSSRSSPPSAGGAPSSSFRGPSSSASPAFYSDVVHSPARADAYSPDLRSPSLSSTSASRDSRQPLERPREPVYGTGQHLSHIQPPFQPSFRQHESWPDSGSSQGSLLNSSHRRHRGEPPTPPLVRHDSTVSSAESAGSMKLPTSGVLPPIDSKMPTRTLPQPIMGGGGLRGPNVDLRSTMTSANMPQQAYGELHGGGASGSSSLPALLRAIEMAKEQAAMEPSGPSEQTEESP